MIANNVANDNLQDVERETLRPRFRKCKEIGCDKMYDCQEKIELRLTNGGYTEDYFCPRKGTYVYWE